MLRRVLGATCLILSSAAPAAAQDFTFDLLYNGGGSFSLQPGSDDPIGTVLVPGQSYFERVVATGGNVWTVINGGTLYFPRTYLVNEDATRTADYTIRYFNGAAQVASFSEVGASQQFVHIGAQTSTLPGGLIFDRVEIDFSLLSALDAGNPTTTTIFSYHNGGPEGALNQNLQRGDIVYGPAATVPEPGTIVLTMSGLGLIGLVARRRARGA